MVKENKNHSHEPEPQSNIFCYDLNNRRIPVAFSIKHRRPGERRLTTDILQFGAKFSLSQLIKGAPITLHNTTQVLPSRTIKPSSILLFDSGYHAYRFDQGRFVSSVTFPQGEEKVSEQKLGLLIESQANERATVEIGNPLSFGLVQ